MNPLADVQAIDFLDVGCRGLLDERWRDLTPVLNYTGFDADAEECKRLSALPHPYKSHRYLPYAIAGEHRDMVFYKTRNPFCASLLQPRRDWIDRFEIGEALEVVEATTVSCTTLNALRERHNLRADIVKVDCQGLDIDIVKGGDSLMDTVFCIETEPAFAKNYMNESTFADNESFMRDNGYLLFDMSLHAAARKNPLARHGKHQVLWCEALWLYDYIGNKKHASRIQALKALLICRRLGFLDYGFELARYFGEYGVIEKGDVNILASASFWIPAETSQPPLSRTAKLLKVLPRRVKERLRWGIEEIYSKRDSIV